MKNLNLTQPKRILFVSHLAGIGGGESFLLSLMGGLDAGLYTPLLLCSRDGMLAERAKEKGIQSRLLPFSDGAGLRKFGRGLLQILALRRIMRDWEADIVHINDMETGKYAALAAKSLCIPVVWTCHGWWYAGRLREFFYRIFIDYVGAVSTPVRDSLTARHILGGKHVGVIHPGLDLERFKPFPPDKAFLNELGVPSDRQIVGIIGRFQPIKGHEVFFDAARIIADRLPQTHFLVVGANVFDIPEEEGYSECLRRRVEADELLSAHTTFTGFQQDIPRLMGLLDVLVSTSYAETFGMVHLEAMACGTPIVSTDSKGPRDLVTDGVTGYLVPVGDSLAVAERVIQVLQNEDERRALGVSGMRRAQTGFSVQHLVAGYQALYQALLKVESE